MKIPIHNRKPTGMILLLGFILGIPCGGLSGEGPLVLNGIFTDGVVLQRNEPLRIWGTAASGERVTVRFLEEEAFARASENGEWVVLLSPPSARSEGTTLEVEGENGSHLVNDVVVGDVWLCAGQSNMAWTVGNSANPEEETARATWPLIREFKVPHRVSGTPLDDLGGKWVSCSPETAGSFSAVAYYFAREIHRETGVPVGLVNSSWGGTQVESWMSDAALREDPSFERIIQRWKDRLKRYPEAMTRYKKKIEEWKRRNEAGTEASDIPEPRRPEGPGSRWMPGGLFNAMIHPLRNMPIKGILWYQGEANAPRYQEYASLFKGLIEDWRTYFGSDVPFYFVQLANFDRKFDKTKMTWAYLRQAQASALDMPATGMAVAIDIGDVNDVHPKNKQEVGRRLALLAKAHLYGKAVEYSGPEPRSYSIGDSLLKIEFSNGDGLHTGGRSLGAFEAAGPDGNWQPVAGRINGNALLVDLSPVPDAVNFRYAWHNFPNACLFNLAGLPAPPFKLTLTPASE